MKRFTETGKWSDPWFRKLSPKLKCLWLYLCDSCDAAGVIDLDFELASFHVGGKIRKADMDKFQSRVIELQGGKLLIRAFIPFQYGVLSADCRPHKSVFDALKRHNLEYPINTLLEGYQYPTRQGQDQETEKDKEGVQGEKPKARGSMDELKAFAVEIGLPASDGEACFHKWQGNGWKNGTASIKDWRATIRSWKASGYLPSQKPNGTHPKHDRSRNTGTANDGTASQYRDIGK